MLSIEEIKEKMDRVIWFHRYEIIPGVETPGFSIVRPKECMDNLGVPSDLSGKRALDIGAWDGAHTFELEARGADVTALDIQDPAHTGFNLSKEILGSKAAYVRGSVYDINKHLNGKFDIILFLGVFYHLKNPILALEQIAMALKENGTVFFEGECLRNYVEDLGGAPVSSRYAEILADSEVPVALCYPSTFKGLDSSNWFIPNFTCTRVWFYTAGLKIIDHHFYEDIKSAPPVQRLSGKAVRFGNPLMECELIPAKSSMTGNPVTPEREMDLEAKRRLTSDPEEGQGASKQKMNAWSESLRELHEELRVSEEDWKARLNDIPESGEKDRSTRREVVQRLEGEIVRLQQQYDELHRKYIHLRSRLPVRVLHKLNLV